MPVDDSQETIWPPSLNLGNNVLETPHRFQQVPGWVGPLIAGIVGAAFGVLLLPAVLLALIYLTNDAGSPIGFVFAMIAFAIMGACVGFVCGMTAWFIGKAILQRRKRLQ